MRLIKFFKIGFLKLVSKRKKRPLPLSKSPKFLLLMNQNIGDMIVTKISELISRHVKKDL